MSVRKAVVKAVSPAKRGALTMASTRAPWWSDDATGGHNILWSTRGQILFDVYKSANSGKEKS